MPNQTRKKLRPEIIMGILALLCAIGLLAMVIVCLPYIRAERLAAAQPPEDADPEDVLIRDPLPQESLPPEPALLDLPKNPYDRYDFQYDGQFLKLIYDDCLVGIDVSSHQGTIDWARVAATDVELVMVRAGYRGYGQAGKLVEDPNARLNMQQARAAGLEVGAYFFSQAITVAEAEEEARMLLQILQGQDITLPVVYDWEYISAEARTAHVDARMLTDCAIAFCRIIRQAGYTPMVYFNVYQSTHRMHLQELEEFEFWLAWYSDRMNYPYAVRMWQYTDKGRVDGIGTNVDLNVWFPVVEP